MPKKAKGKSRKTRHLVGRGIFDFLKTQAKGLLQNVKNDPLGFAQQVSNTVGIKPSDILSKFTQGKDGSVGTLGNLGAALLQQKGLGCKCGDEIMTKEMLGSGFFDDFVKGFSMPFKAIGDLAGSAINPVVGALAPSIGVLGAPIVRGLMGGGPSSFRGSGIAGYPNAYSAPGNVSGLRLV